jgi:hypothetical protein
MNRTPGSRHRSAIAALPALPALQLSVGLLVAGALSAPAPARADHLPDPIELHREIHHEVRGLLHDLVRVPLALHREHVRHLEAFFGGRDYYGPHRHYHDRYAFPVWAGEEVVYQPYSYCEGRLFAPPRVRPHLWHEWGAPRAARYCNHHRGYYPAAHGCFHQSSYRRYDRDWDDHRGDWDRDHRSYRRYRDWDRHDRYDRYDRHDRDRDRHGDWDRHGRGRGRGHHKHHRGCGHH